jgi:hypothetical protein
MSFKVAPGRTLSRSRAIWVATSTRRRTAAVLGGEMTLRQVADSEVCGAALSRSFARFWSDYQEMSPEERAALASRARVDVDE